MFGKKIQDLHGHIFEFDGKFESSSTFPVSLKNSGKMTFNRDRITDT